MSDAVILYNTEDGGTQLRLKIQDGTVWLTQAEMAALFQTTKQNVSVHTFDAARKAAEKQAAEIEYEQDVEAELRALETTASRSRKQAKKDKAP